MTSRIRYGGDWNPEQWPEEVWDEDLALMQQAGVNLVSVGIFSWAMLEPREGELHFDWLDRLLDKTHAAGIDIDLATPTASAPPWLGTAHPETLWVDERGVRVGHGARNHYCPSSEVYREHCRRIAGELGRRYGAHPGVVMWHLGNEYGPACFCDLCAASFRTWLERRYDDLDGLNEAWGTTFWSQRYSDWAEVCPPRFAPYVINPSQRLDWRRFTSDNLIELIVEQRGVLRPLVGGSPITTNLMGFFDTIDYQRLAPELDLIADDHYKDPDDPDGPARAALIHDLMRGLAGGTPWMMMEQAMGAVSWRPRNVPKTDVQRRHDVLRAVAHGADGVLSFQWRQARFGSERFHSAMLPNVGPDSRLHRGVRAIGVDLAALSGLVGTVEPARVALLFDWTSWWTAEEPTVPAREHTPVLTQLEQWYRPLWRRGLTVDVVPGTADLDSYDLVLAPVQHALDAEGLAALRARIDAGRETVLGPFSAAVDEHDRLLPGGFPGGLTDLLGATGEQWWPVGRVPVPFTSALLGDGQITSWAEQLTVGDADVLASADHSDLGALVVRNGSFTYVGADLPGDALDKLVDDVLECARVPTDDPLLTDTPDGVEFVRRGGATFVFDLTGQGGRLDLRAPVRDLLTGSDHHTTIDLPPGGTLVLQGETA